MTKQSIDSDIFNRLKTISELSGWNIPTKLKEFLDTVKPKASRTLAQNSGLHLWLTMKSTQCVDAGIGPDLIFKETMELEMNPTIMKEIWRYAQKAMYKKESTTELSKNEDELGNIAEHLNRFFSKEPFFLEGIPLPSKDIQNPKLDHHDMQKNRTDYPDRDGMPTV